MRDIAARLRQWEEDDLLRREERDPDPVLCDDRECGCNDTGRDEE